MFVNIIVKLKCSPEIVEKSKYQPSPLKANRFRLCLYGHENPLFYERICEGIQYGFRVPFLGKIESLPVISPNLPLNDIQYCAVLDDLCNEITTGRIIKLSSNIKTLYRIPLGTVPKDIFKFRVIRHCSYPRLHPYHKSLNSGIPDDARVEFQLI